MKISELILAIGDDNVEFQNLDTCADKLNMNGGITKITFGSEQTLSPNGTKKLGLVLWLDREDVRAALAQETPTRQRQDRNGLGPKDGGSVGVADAPEPQSDTPS